MMDILYIGDEPIFDDRIVKIETHTYNPYASATFGYSDEIRIPIQQQDLYTLPCESFLYIEEHIVEDIDADRDEQQWRCELVNNCVAFMFDEIRYELDGVEIDRNRNVGITSTIKSYASMTTERSKRLKNAGWNVHSINNAIRLTDNLRNFNFCVPLNMFLGFCEDYKRIMINAHHELVLICARNDVDSIIAQSTSKNPKLTLLKVQWRMPHVVLNDLNKLSLLHTLESGRYLSMTFRSWDLYEFPLLQTSTKHSWAVKAAGQLEKPRYVIFVLQTGRRGVPTADVSKFDDYKLSNVKLYLNSEFYPYDDMNLDFENNRFALLHDMYAKFRKTYYGREIADVYLPIDKFLQLSPITVIDCSRQNESIKSGTVDVRLEFECKRDVPAKITAFCLIIHDRVVEYNPLTNVVRKIE
ncbi:PREDICTED: uncharacterized protein LOC106750293 [Dinoponera quadriceps]|uniref:Uncharacterized protein LOC106750293 n=1 Tax=Dinoponera quadriceps TaxID=609295 RepID=A0A6P3Y7L6_DINQU|nr:PREDICTED: uncharacterized protein LOC106750293 [Dinoponera quadriceps]